MEHEFIFYPKKNFVIIRTHGHATLEGFKIFVIDLLNDTQWVKGMTILVDHRDVDFNGISKSDVDTYRNFIVENSDIIGPARIAAVMSEALGYGLGRMWEIPLRCEVAFEHHVFYSINDAVT
ncbi:conserved hypothetical protein [Candidatus Brocadia pituitae]|nr:conserved hypothetical protein [Candidatus Brocadia pituitae]